MYENSYINQMQNVKLKHCKLWLYISFLLEFIYYWIPKIRWHGWLTKLFIICTSFLLEGDSNDGRNRRKKATDLSIRNRQMNASITDFGSAQSIRKKSSIFLFCIEKAQLSLSKVRRKIDFILSIDYRWWCKRIEEKTIKRFQN